VPGSLTLVSSRGEGPRNLGDLPLIIRQED
jgi:hypothetical protein